MSDFIETTRRYQFKHHSETLEFEVPETLARTVLRMRELGAEHAAILKLANGLQTDPVQARIALDVMSSSNPVGWDEALEAGDGPPRIGDGRFNKVPQDDWTKELTKP